MSRKVRRSETDILTFEDYSFKKQSSKFKFHNQAAKNIDKMKIL